MNRIPCRLLLTALFLLPAAVRQEAGAATKTVGSFDEVVDDAAAEILTFTKDQTLTVGEFSKTNTPGSNSGPAIAELLKTSLLKLHPGILKEDDAAFVIKGDFARSRHPDRAELQVVKLTFRIIGGENGDETRVPVTRFVEDNSAIARLIVASGPVPLDRTLSGADAREARNKEIFERAKNPKSFVDPADPTRISSVPGSPFQIEVLAQPLADVDHRSPTPRKARLNEKGLAVVDLERNEVYEIRVHNGSSDEVAVRVFIDGLDIFHFSADRHPGDKSKPRFSHLILPPGGTQTVFGWHKSLAEQRFDRFLVTEYGKGAASSAGIAASGTGVIQVQFSKAHVVAADRRKKSAANETGFGPPKTVAQTVVEREIEPPIDFVTVRYSR